MARKNLKNKRQAEKTKQAKKTLEKIVRRVCLKVLLVIEKEQDAMLNELENIS